MTCDRHCEPLRIEWRGRHEGHAGQRTGDLLRRDLPCRPDRSGADRGGGLQQRTGLRGLPDITLLQYVTSSSFAVDVAENWQSEYLQFLLFILATVWLVQRGSPESKPVGPAGHRVATRSRRSRSIPMISRRRSARGGVRCSALYSRSLGIVMGPIFAVELVRRSSSPDELPSTSSNCATCRTRSSYMGYLHSADFWNRSLQNWQSEFLAVGSMVVLVDLPPAARITRVQAGGRAACRDRHRR